MRKAKLNWFTLSIILIKPLFQYTFLIKTISQLFCLVVPVFVYKLFLNQGLSLSLSWLYTESGISELFLVMHNVPKIKPARPRELKIRVLQQ